LLPFYREKGIRRYSNTNCLVALFVSHVLTLLLQVQKDAMYVTRDPHFTFDRGQIQPEERRNVVSGLEYCKDSFHPSAEAYVSSRTCSMLGPLPCWLALQENSKIA
jgi:hypothetical protein